jgi:flagellar motor protein MotB
MANVPSPDFNQQAIRRHLESIAFDGGIIGLIVPDGNAGVRGALTEVNDNGGSFEPVERSMRRHRSTQQYRRGEFTDALVERLVAESTASTAEANILAAIRAGGTWLAEQPDNYRKVMVIIHSGLQTVAPLDMWRAEWEVISQEFVEDLGIEALIQSLDDNRHLPNLRHIDAIEWINIGVVADSQEVPDETQIVWLQNIWRDVIDASNGPRVTFRSGLSSTGERDNLPRVMPIPMGDIEPRSAFDDIPIVEPPPIEEVREEIEETDGFLEPLVLDRSVAFNPNRDTFLNPEAADAVFREVARDLISRPDTDITIFGGVAKLPTSTLEGSLRLSRERAEAARAALIRHGVCETRIRVVGTAWINPLFNPNIPQDDAHRFIIIVNSESDFANEAYSMLRQNGIDH